MPEWTNELKIFCQALINKTVTHKTQTLTMLTHPCLPLLLILIIKYSPKTQHWSWTQDTWWHNWLLTYPFSSSPFWSMLKWFRYLDMFFNYTKLDQNQCDLAIVMCSNENLYVKTNFLLCQSRINKRAGSRHKISLVCELKF